MFSLAYFSLAQDSHQTGQSLRAYPDTMSQLRAKQNRRTTMPAVDPRQAAGRVGPTPPARTTTEALELTSTLQTTLEIDKLIELFAREVRRHIEVDGVAYDDQDGHAHIRIGEQALHRASYEIVVDGEPLGELRVHRVHPFTADELTRFENLLCALVYPLRNALSYQLAVERALRDPLTGALNRAALEEALQREVEVARRQGTPLGVLFVDIDHFKQVNDTYGHGFGDDVLRAVAHAVSDTIRRSDALYRYGGEEFVVIASHTQPIGGQQLGERIRSNVAAIGTVGGRELQVTVSVGVAGLRAGETGDALLRRADAALYRAKESGRNRVESGDFEAAGSC
jgi:diguanylate cyclase (GGDEF)-like protein